MVTATTAVFIVSHALCMTLPETTTSASDGPGLGGLPDIVDIHILSFLDKPESFWCHTNHNDSQTFYAMFLTPNVCVSFYGVCFLNCFSFITAVLSLISILHVHDAFRGSERTSC